MYIATLIKFVSETSIYASPMLVTQASAYAHKLNQYAETILTGLHLSLHDGEAWPLDNAK